MRNHNFSRFFTNFNNLSNNGALLEGEVYDPEKQATAFEEPVRLLRLPLNSVAQAGDHIVGNAEHYVLATHSTDLKSVVFRLVSLPDLVTYSYSATIPDTVTGLKRPSGVNTNAQIYVRKINNNFERDIENFEKEKVRYVLSQPVTTGQTLAARTIQRTWIEQGVYLAET